MEPSKNSWENLARLAKSSTRVVSPNGTLLEASFFKPQLERSRQRYLAFDAMGESKQLFCPPPLVSNKNQRQVDLSATIKKSKDLLLGRLAPYDLSSDAVMMGAAQSRNQGAEEQEDVYDQRVPN